MKTNNTKKATKQQALATAVDRALETIDSKETSSVSLQAAGHGVIKDDLMR